MIIAYLCAAFFTGAIIASAIAYSITHTRTHVIKRFCPYLQVARDMYNALQKYFDENADSFKLISLKIKRVDDKCHMVICKYRSLKDGAMFTI